MRRFVFCVMMLCMLSTVVEGGAASEYNFRAGVGKVDITPGEKILLAGSPSARKTTEIDTRLFVKAIVIEVGEQKVAIVALDTLKYQTELAVKARKQIEQTTHIPADNIIISCSHTHYGPLWSYYKDKLITPIGKAVELAVDDLGPCKIGTTKGKAEGVSKNRRALKNGEAWNTWLLNPPEKDKYPAEGPADPEVGILAVMGKDGRYKAIVYNFACHAANTRKVMISADYPGRVQKYITENLGYEVATLFLAGACGNVNPNRKESGDVFGEKLGEEIMQRLGSIEYIVKPTLLVESREEEMPGRENPQFNEEDVARKWPKQLEHYRKAFKEMKKRARPNYKFIFTGVRISDDFAIITNPVELFCEIGMSIKNKSPFKNTMVATLTNGARGYVPTAKAFELKGYETWFGEHSYLSTRAGDIIEKESLDILNQLKMKNKVN